jgi:DNA-binding response OmpR family regulator
LKRASARIRALLRRSQGGAARAQSCGKLSFERGASDSSSRSGSIEVYIHRVRRKLAGSGLVIRTVRGLGDGLERD